MKQRMGKITRRLNAICFMIFGWALPIHEKRVLFLTFQGAYTCNPKYICESIHKSKPDYDMIWVSGSDEYEFPPYVRTVKMGSAEYFFSLYTSKFWIDNAFNVEKLPAYKKRKQILLETMHGALGIKRIDSESNRDQRRNRRGTKCGKWTDYILSNSSFEDMVYETSFWKKEQILPYGHPRNDIILQSDSKRKDAIRQQVRFRLGLSPEEKLALYAPTFQRDNKAEPINLDEVRSALESRFGGTWTIVQRMHPRDIRTVQISESTHVIDGNRIVDIQELILAVDVGITDYSSWIFDFVLTGNPGFVYAPDVEEYEEDTGFYYPLSECPFPVTNSNEQLSKAIRSFQHENYAMDVKTFLRKRGCWEDGHAAERCVRLIENL